MAPASADVQVPHSRDCYTHHNPPRPIKTAAVDLTSLVARSLDIGRCAGKGSGARRRARSDLLVDAWVVSQRVV